MSECQFGSWDLPTVLTFEDGEFLGEREALQVRRLPGPRQLHLCLASLPADFLTVPQNGDLSSSSSLDVTDLFLPELSFEGSAEVGTARRWRLLPFLSR